MAANVDAMIREGIKASREGKKDDARTLLLKAVELDEHNEQAWLWLSAVVDSPEDQQTCLENVLAINPNNEKARQGLRYLKQKIGGGGPASSPSGSQPAVEEAFANISFTQPAAPPVSDLGGPFSASSFVDDVDDTELPNSVAWSDPAPAPSFPTSSASARPPVDELSSSDYDDWVAGLNLTGKNPQPDPPVSSPQPVSSPFVMDDIEEINFGFDENPPLPESTQDNLRDVFGVEDDFDDEPISKPAPPSKAGGQMRSPTPNTPKAADDVLFDLETVDLDNDDFLEDYDQANLGEIDPQEFFKHIPVEIKPTRLPGVSERLPVLMLLGLILLVAANVGAVILVLNTLGVR